MLDFRLKVFYTVASEKSFTKAAHKHNITQPAVSKHIQELERIYGITLFERRGSSILLTEAGRILYEQAKNIDEIYREIDYRISSLKEEHKGELRLGASTSIAQYVLPEAIARFYNYYPAIKLSLISGNTEQVEQALLDKEIDLALSKVCRATTCCTTPNTWTTNWYPSRARGACTRPGNTPWRTSRNCLWSCARMGRGRWTSCARNC